VSGIANVTGSQGNDILVGDQSANILRGGTGRNLIIGGGGLNGSFVLNTDPTLGPVTVFDDGAADVLNGGGGLDWFFAHKKQDVINNSKPGDKTTQV
jgi:Ca2+-binding RTX toxin-like protein